MSFNGYTNYETWRINLEIFDGLKEDWDAEQCKEYAFDIVEQSPELALDYARAFIRQANFMEISEHLKED